MTFWINIWIKSEQRTLLKFISPDSFSLVIGTTRKFTVTDITHITFLLDSNETEKQCCFRSKITEEKNMLTFHICLNLNANQPHLYINNGMKLDEKI